MFANQGLRLTRGRSRSIQVDGPQRGLIVRLAKGEARARCVEREIAQQRTVGGDDRFRRLRLKVIVEARAPKARLFAEKNLEVEMFAVRGNDWITGADRSERNRLPLACVDIDDGGNEIRSRSRGGNQDRGFHNDMRSIGNPTGFFMAAGWAGVLSEPNGSAVVDVHQPESCVGHVDGILRGIEAETWGAEDQRLAIGRPLR